MQKRYEFERMFIAVVVDLVEEKGISHSEFARLALDVANPETKWRRLRNGGPEGRQPHISLPDAYSMAATLGRRYAELAFIAEERLRTESSN